MKLLPEALSDPLGTGCPAFVRAGLGGRTFGTSPATHPRSAHPGIQRRARASPPRRGFCEKLAWICSSAGPGPVLWRSSLVICKELWCSSHLSKLCSSGRSATSSCFHSRHSTGVEFPNAARRPNHPARAWPQGKHRPVAVGETSRRLTAKALLATVTQHLHPAQLGLGTPSGCEAIVRSIRRRQVSNRLSVATL